MVFILKRYLYLSFLIINILILSACGDLTEKKSDKEGEENKEIVNQNKENIEDVISLNHFDNFPTNKENVEDRTTEQLYYYQNFLKDELDYIYTNVTEIVKNSDKENYKEISKKDRKNIILLKQRYDNISYLVFNDELYNDLFKELDLAFNNLFSLYGERYENKYVYSYKDKVVPAYKELENLYEEYSIGIALFLKGELTTINHQKEMEYIINYIESYEKRYLDLLTEYDNEIYQDDVAKQNELTTKLLDLELEFKENIKRDSVYYETKKSLSIQLEHLLSTKVEPGLYEMIFSSRVSSDNYYQFTLGAVETVKTLEDVDKDNEEYIELFADRSYVYYNEMDKLKHFYNLNN